MDNNQKFLEIFGKTEKYLRELTQDEKSPFYVLLRKARQKNRSIRYFARELRQLAGLRNFMSHENGQEMILLTDKPIEELSFIFEKISNPPTVFDKFEKPVYTCKTSDLLSDVLKSMKENVYTHVPVYEEGEFRGVLSEASVSNWLADKKRINLDEVKIQELNEFIQHQSNEFFGFVRKNENAYNVREMFYKEVDKHERLGVVFITETGDLNEKILGLITAWDLPILNLKKESPNEE